MDVGYNAAHLNLHKTNTHTFEGINNKKRRE